MINICLGHAASGNQCDLISKDIFQPITGNESFISDKWGREEFWKFPLGCNNNWSQIFLLYMWGENTGGLTYLIGHVKTTLLGREESEYASGKHSTRSAHTQTNQKHTEQGRWNTPFCWVLGHDQISACHYHVVTQYMTCFRSWGRQRKRGVWRGREFFPQTRVLSFALVPEPTLF